MGEWDQFDSDRLLGCMEDVHSDDVSIIKRADDEIIRLRAALAASQERVRELEKSAAFPAPRSMFAKAAERGDRLLEGWDAMDGEELRTIGWRCDDSGRIDDRNHCLNAADALDAAKAQLADAVPRALLAKEANDRVDELRKDAAYFRGKEDDAGAADHFTELADEVEAFARGVIMRTFPPTGAAGAGEG